MNNNYKWKGITFNSKGIIIDKTPTISKGKKDIDTITIPGRNGFLTIDKGTYQPFVVSLECHAKGSANYDEIKAFLDGYGTLSFDGSREYTAVIQNAIEFSKALQFKRFPIEFLVNPIAEDITPTTYTVLASGNTLTITDANAPMYPTLQITISGQTSFIINGYSFSLSTAGTYTLDCKNMVIIDSNNNNAANIMDGDFPVLDNSNTITYDGNVTSFQIVYKKAYL